MDDDFFLCVAKPLPSDLTLRQTPDDGAVVDGSSFSMTCLVDSGVYQPPTIQWIHNETQVVKTEKRNFSLTHEVPFLNGTNGGRYGCSVQNEQGETIKNLLNIFEAAGMVKHLAVLARFIFFHLRFSFQFDLKLANFRRMVTTRRPATSLWRGKATSLISFAEETVIPCQP